MKKLFATIVFAGAALAAVAADTYYYSPTKTVPPAASRGMCNGYAAKVGEVVAQLIQVPQDKVNQCAGNNVTEVDFYTGIHATPTTQGFTDPIYNEVEVVLTHGLLEEPFYTQRVTLPKGHLKPVNVELTTPQTVDGTKPLYVGFRLTVVDEYDFPFPSDYEVAAAREGDNYSFIVNGDYASTSAMNVSSSEGRACIGVTFTGDNLPQNGVKIVEAKIPAVADLNQPFTFPVTVEGTAANKASTVKIDYTIGGKQGFFAGDILDPVTRKPKAIGQYEQGVVEVSGVVSSTPSFTTSMSLRVTGVNGLTNLTSSEAYAADELATFVLADGFERVIAVEEATSLTCGYCPAGAALLDYVTETYPGRFVTIAYHVNYGGTPDPMTTDSGTAWANYYTRSYPHARFNRTTNAEVVSFVNGKMKSWSIADKLYEKLCTANTFSKVDVAAEFTDDSKQALKVDSKVKFALDLGAADNYMLSYAVTEDRMGPYRQTNNYAGSSNDVGGWENKSSRVNDYVNHVSRNLIGFPGVSGSVKSNLKKGEVSDHSLEIPIDNVRGSRVKVIAMLVNSLTREVMNADEVELRIREDEPWLSHKEGSYDEPFYLELTCTEGATIHYTMSDTEEPEDPTVESAVYTEPLYINSDKKKMYVKAMAVSTEFGQSTIAKAEYRLRSWDSIDSIATGTTGTVEWYTLQGIRVDNPAPGAIYVKVTDGVAEKVLVK